MAATQCAFCNVDKSSQSIVRESRYFYVLQDQNPIMQDHLLLITKKHIRRYDEMGSVSIIPLLGHIMHYREVQWVTKYLLNKTGVDPFMFINSPHQQSVPHYHLHFVPADALRSGAAQKAFKNFLHQYTEEAMRG